MGAEGITDSIESNISITLKMYSAKEILKTLRNHSNIFTGFSVTDHLLGMLSFHECYLRDLFKKSQLQSQASRSLKQSQPLYKI